MRQQPTRPSKLLAIACFWMACAGAGCGGTTGDQPVTADASIAPGADAATPGPTLVALTVQPAAPTITCSGGASGTQTFTATGTFSDGTTTAVEPGWSADHLELGIIDWKTGVYAASGSRGGVTMVTATLGNVTAKATLTVKVTLEVKVPGPTMPTNPASFFAGAAGTDASRAPQLLYPEDETVYPVGVYQPELQWQGGAQNDLFRVRLTDQYTTLTAYSTDPAFLMSTTFWSTLGDSNTGTPVKIEVAATAMKDPSHLVFTGASRSLRLAQARLGGTVYYWDLDAGKILRIRPKTAIAGEFFTPPLKDDSGNRCVACHTLSRDGRKMAFQYYGGDGPGGVADVATGSVIVAPNVYNANFSTFNPDGSRLVTSWGDGRFTLRDATSGAPIPAGTGEGNLTAVGSYNSHPTWSPDGGLLAYACQATPASFGWDVEFGASGLCTIAWSQAAQQFDAASVKTVVANDGLAHFYPTFSADSRFLIYNQGETCPYGPRILGKHLSLWLVAAAGGTPVQLSRAAWSDQDLYPNFSPFIEGGYHWVAFYSRRAYGWRTAAPRRQIWVAAVDKNPAGGVDPSHPGFWLPGQNTTSDNCSAYWAQEPCRAMGESCTADVDCCGGLVCSGPAGAKTCVPPPTPCTPPGHLCKSSADCCGGYSCIPNSAGEQVCAQAIQ